MKKLEQFMETKQHLTEDCINVGRMATENDWAINRVSTYICDKYKGIDQFIILHTVLNHHFENEGRTEIVEAMDEHFWQTIERWINPTPQRDEEKFILSAVTTIFRIPTKY